MKRPLKISLLALSILIALSMAEAQQFGTKVQVGDPDMGLPLSAFSLVGTPPFQAAASISFWDVGSTPGIFDDQDVLYLQFGTPIAGTMKVVKVNDIRLTGWGIYPPGSRVKQGDADVGQMLYPNPWAVPPYTSFAATGFQYMNLVGSAGYDLGDPVYLKTVVPTNPTITNTNDIRITPVAGFPAGSRVSLADPDAGKPLVPFKTGAPLFGMAGGLTLATVIGPVAQLAFFNANGNVDAAGSPIYDNQENVYLDVAPLNVVSPNDVRLFD